MSRDVLNPLNWRGSLAFSCNLCHTLSRKFAIRVRPVDDLKQRLKESVKISLRLAGVILLATIIGALWEMLTR